MSGMYTTVSLSETSQDSEHSGGSEQASGGSSSSSVATCGDIKQEGGSVYATEASSEQNPSDGSNDGADDDGDEREQRKIRRVMANRRSARESRERRKRLLVELEESVHRLSDDNKKLTSRNVAMKKEITEILGHAGVSLDLNSLASAEIALQALIEAKKADILAAQHLRGAPI